MPTHDRRETSGSIRVALVGFGFAGRIFHAPLITSTPGLTLAVIVSSQGGLVREHWPGVEVVADAADAVRRPDLDLVVVATPNEVHAPIAEAALRAGKHVVVDKPFTVTLAEARALAATAAGAARLLSVFQNRRWDSDFLGIRQALAAGRIGEVLELRSEISRYRPQVRDRWRERAGPGAGLWYDLGPHLVDQALVLFGPPDTVHADLQIQRTGGTAVDWFHAVLGYGRRRVLLSSSMISTDAPARFLVRGTEGSLIKRRGDVQEQQLLDGITPGTPGWGDDPDPVVLAPGGGGAAEEIAAPAGRFGSYYEAMRDAIVGDGRVPVTPGQAVALMAVLEAGLQSAKEGCLVIPDYTDADRSAWEPVVRPA